MRFVFWNTARRKIPNAVVSLIKGTRPDVLALTEYEEELTPVLRALQEAGLTYFELPNIGCTRIRILTTILPRSFRIVLDHSRYTIREYSKIGHVPMLVVLVHLPSKNHLSEGDLLHEAAYLRKDIESAERLTKNGNTVVCGDFNMNPFEGGMTNATALHSLSCLRTASGRPRVIQGREHSYFYNPTWNLLGDVDDLPGTYFYRDPSYTSYYWNVLDQVILRPSIAKRLDKASVRIVPNADGLSFLDENGRPGTSDHLPISFVIDSNLDEGKHEKLVA